MPEPIKIAPITLTQYQACLILEHIETDMDRCQYTIDTVKPEESVEWYEDRLEDLRVLHDIVNPF